MTFMTFARLFLRLILIGVLAQAAPAGAQTLQDILLPHQQAVEKASRKTVDAILEDLVSSNLPQVPDFLEKWQSKDLWMRKDDAAFFYIGDASGGAVDLIDITTGAVVGSADTSDLKQLKPNSGVRSVIAVALVQFQLSDPDPARRLAALQAIERDPDESQLDPLRRSMDGEEDPELKARKTTLERLLTARFGRSSDIRVAAIEALTGSLSVETRAALNPMVVTRRAVFSAPPDNVNIAARLTPGTDALGFEEAYALLVEAELAPPAISRSARNDALVANIADGKVAGIAVETLDSEDMRDTAYAGLAQAGTVPLRLTDAGRAEAIAAHFFYDIYTEPDAAVTAAAAAALASIDTQVGLYQTVDLLLDGISLASIYFLAAIGLAITFGVMRVINMAHGEFIMLGAYTGYVVQLYVADYTLSLVVALPLAFVVTFAAGVAMERLVIRHLYKRPLETLLATFGISIALQQIAKNIFGTQARPLTAPSWLEGAWVLNDVVSISYIRIAIFVLGLAFLLLLLFILNRTRLGLEVRAVTQNPGMAASMGINPARINMMTFGLGSGIAGIAGVAIGLYAKVTSELGSDYIVQSFMTVVVGGVGNIWGTLLGATMIGNLQKLIEWFNPSNTLAAQTYMILFIILFIQFRPRGIIALKGRAAGD
jgi:urea transport system permease protein